jgi:hypothetical protein
MPENPCPSEEFDPSTTLMATGIQQRHFIQLPLHPNWILAWLLD